MSKPLQRLGAHVGAKWTTPEASVGCLRTSVSIGANTMQVFTKSNRSWQASDLSEEVASKFRDSLAASGLSEVVAHASYLINLATDKKDLAKKSTQGLLSEMQRCQQLGIKYLVLHPGSHTGRGLEIGTKNVALRLCQSATTILLENSAGQGTSIGTKLEELKSIYDLCPETFQSRLGYCIDTCHAFSAGYDLRTEEGYNEFMDEVERFLGTKQSYVLIAGWEKLKCIHLNDSKTALGGRSDRHDNIGHGKLTMYPFWRIMNDPRLVMVPKILETPVTSVSHEEEIRLLLNLIGSPTKKEEANSS